MYTGRKRMSKTIPVRLEKEEVSLIDSMLEKDRSFLNRSDFVRFAVRYMLYENFQRNRFLKQRLSEKRDNLTKKEAEITEKELHKVRGEIWKEMKDYYGIKDS